MRVMKSVVFNRSSATVRDVILALACGRGRHAEYRCGEIRDLPPAIISYGLLGRVPYRSYDVQNCPKPKLQATGCLALSCALPFRPAVWLSVRTGRELI